MHDFILAFLASFFGGMCSAAIAKRHVKSQRSWFLSVLMAEYGYWRDARSPSDTIAQRDMDDRISIGAMGAVSNVVAAVNGHPAPWHPPAVVRKDGSK